jgi:hypothetical protein
MSEYTEVFEMVSSAGNQWTAEYIIKLEARIAELEAEVALLRTVVKAAGLALHSAVLDMLQAAQEQGK